MENLEAVKLNSKVSMGIGVQKVEAKSIDDVKSLTADGEAHKQQIQTEILKKISGVDIAISIDDESMPPVVRIMDKATGNEIVQIPSDTSVAIQKSVQALLGLVFDRKA